MFCYDAFTHTNAQSCALGCIKRACVCLTANQCRHQNEKPSHRKTPMMHAGPLSAGNLFLPREKPAIFRADFIWFCILSGVLSGDLFLSQ